MIEHDLKFYLKKYFGYSSFKEGQEEVIKALIDQKDAIAILPTGTGKSMCYQLTGKHIDLPVPVGKIAIACFTVTFINPRSSRAITISRRTQSFSSNF